MNATAAIATRTPTEIDVRPKTADAAPDGAKPERSFWQRVFGDDGVTFSTVLDVINPLQHIPVVSTIYREITGDKIAPGAKLIGDALFGGPIGLALSAVDVTIQGETGKDVGQHVVAMLKPKTPESGDTAIAAATPGAVPSDSAASPTAAADDATPEQKPDTAETKPVQVAAAAPKPPTAPAIDPAAYAPRSQFVAAAMKPRTPANGIGGAFVRLETRSTIAPPSLFAPVSLAAPATRDDAVKPAAKNSIGVPDAKTVAADPNMLRSLRANGVRPAPAQSASGPAVTVPVPPPLLPLAAPTDVGGSNDVGDAMARNLERYMALRNRRPAPTKVDRAL